MDRVNEVTRHCFNAIIQLRRASAENLPPPESVLTRMRGFIETMMQKASRAGFIQQDCQDIAYAIVALADEIAVGKSESFRLAWLPQLLQLHFFKENTAGTGFYERLENLKNDPQRIEVLRVYYYSLLLGFQGKHRNRSGEIELMREMETLQQIMGRAYKPLETISPRPKPIPAASSGPRRTALLLASVGVLLFSILFYSGLRVALTYQTGSVVEEITAAGNQRQR